MANTQEEIDEFVAKFGCFCGGTGTYVNYDQGGAYEADCPHCRGTGRKVCPCLAPSLECSGWCFLVGAGSARYEVKPVEEVFTAAIGTKLRVVVDPSMPPGRIELRDASGRVLGVITNFGAEKKEENE